MSGLPIGSFTYALQHQLDELPMMVHGVFHGNTTAQYESTQRFRKLLSIGKVGLRSVSFILSGCRKSLVCFAERNPPIEEVIKTGVIPKFVEFLQRHDSPQLQVTTFSHFIPKRD